MRLKFYKKEDKNCISIINGEGQEMEFDYVEMIKLIYSERSIDNAEITDDFTEGEKHSINSLVSNISESIEPLFLEDKTPVKLEGDSSEEL